MKPSLHRLPGSYSVHRLAPQAALPDGLLAEPFYALLKSSDELSVCCRSDFTIASDREEPGWACLAVAGPLDFALTGIVAGLTAPLADAGIAVFVISSFDTDYLLLKQAELTRATAVLAAAGFTVKAQKPS
ncbi:MAG: ACT domain-containing protein [Pseudomonadales bacterium]